MSFITKNKESDDIESMESFLVSYLSDVDDLETKVKVSKEMTTHIKSFIREIIFFIRRLQKMTSSNNTPFPFKLALEEFVNSKVLQPLMPLIEKTVLSSTNHEDTSTTRPRLHCLSLNQPLKLISKLSDEISQEDFIKFQIREAKFKLDSTKLLTEEEVLILKQLYDLIDSLGQTSNENDLSTFQEKDVSDIKLKRENTEVDKDSEQVKDEEERSKNMYSKITGKIKANESIENCSADAFSILTEKVSNPKYCNFFPFIISKTSERLLGAFEEESIKEESIVSLLSFFYYLLNKSEQSKLLKEEIFEFFLDVVLVGKEKYQSWIIKVMEIILKKYVFLLDEKNFGVKEDFLLFLKNLALDNDLPDSKNLEISNLLEFLKKPW